MLFTEGDDDHSDVNNNAELPLSQSSFEYEMTPENLL